jgi:hypothetical protein
MSSIISPHVRLSGKFKLSGGEEGTINDLDIVIQALAAHTGLRILDFGGIAMGGGDVIH